MSETIVVTIDDEGSTTLAAYCLKTDSWHDFLALKEDAKQSILEGHQRRTNRCLRAALMCLFSHLEAVIKDIEKCRHVPQITHPRRRWPTFYDRIQNITREASNHGKISPLNLGRGKHLRDLVAHPGIEIKLKNALGETIDFTSLFEELDLATLEPPEAEISFWIDSVCAVLGTSRLTDTEQLITELSNSIGAVTSIKEV